MIRSTTHISGVHQHEKELVANVYVNRSNEIVRVSLTTSLFQGDKGILTGEVSNAAMEVSPRLFGFCGGSHHLAATLALESAWGTQVPAQANSLRSVAQAAEILQNTSRWFYMTFAPDLTHERFAEYPVFEEAKDRFERMKGRSFRAGAFASKHPIALYALVGGQWPHANFLLPGGIREPMTLSTLTRAFALLEAYRTEWLEPVWLGCSVERYQEISTWDELMSWLEEKEAHRNSDLGLFLRSSLAYGLDATGTGLESFLSYGAFSNSSKGVPRLDTPGGFFDEGAYKEISTDQLKASIQDSSLQDVAYANKATEVGPLARMIMAANPALKGQRGFDPLFGEILTQKGNSVLLRALARMHEAPRLFVLIQNWLSEIELNSPHTLPAEEQAGTGLGMTEAPRGALLHQVNLADHKISRYHILAPTLYNIRSGDDRGLPNPLAKALQGVRIMNPNHPVEVGLIARSFDACLVCNVNLFKHRSEKYISSSRV